MEPFFIIGLIVGLVALLFFMGSIFKTAKMDWCDRH